MKLSTKLGERGTTLIEASIAACTSALFLGSLFTMNVTSMKTLRTAREAAAASQVLQQRVETLRIANWHQITNPTWIKDNVLNTNASGTDSLKGITETLTLIPYGSGATGNTQLVRSDTGTQITSTNSTLLAEGAVKVVWTVAYTGSVRSEAITRQAVAIVAKGGVAKW